MTEETFPLSWSTGVRWLCIALGVGPRWSHVRVDEDLVVVRMGYAFRARIRRTAIVAAAPDHARVTAWGVHGWRGRWLVNGSSRGVVRLDLEPAPRALVLGIPVRLRQLRVSVEDPLALLRAMGTGA